MREGSQPTAQSESIGKDCERTGAAGDDDESSERYREAQREHDDDEDRE